MTFEFLTQGGMNLALMIVAAIFGTAILIFMIWCIIDAVRTVKDSKWMIIWIIVIILLPLLGALLYYHVGKHQKNSRIAAS